MIEKVDLRKNSFNLNLARDLFIVACYTGGLRISDYRKLKFKFNTSTNRYFLDYTSKKANTFVKIPVFKNVQTIYEKYEKKFPMFSMEKTYRENLEQVCKLAGLTDEVYITSSFGREKKGEYFPRYELVKPHTARRTYASIMVNDYEMNPLQVMVLTGHTDMDSFMKYCKFNNEKIYKETSNKLDKLKL